MILENLLRDVRFACRSLIRARAFSTVAVLTLAVGIAGATVMFALVQAVLLRPLPVRDQQRLVVVWKELRSSGFAHYPFGDAEIEEVAHASSLLEDVAGMNYSGAWRWTATENGESAYLSGAPVTGRFFDVLGVDPVLGRTLAREDDVEGAENVLVVSHGLWQRRYGGSPDVVGRRLTLDDLPFTIVGVMPEGFDYPFSVDVWRTTRSVPISATFGDSARSEVDMIGRLRPGVTIEQVTSELTTLTRQYERTSPDTPSGLLPVVRPFTDHVVGDVRPALIAVFAAVGLVLMIATANVANLLLMRSEMRQSEFAVRQALGAGRGRIVPPLLVENLLLALAAAVVGVVVAWWALPGLITLLPEGVPRVETVSIDAGVVAVATSLTLIAALLASLGPALFSTHLNLVSSLRRDGRRVTNAAARRGRRGLVVGQVALAVVVVAAASLLTRTVVHMQSVDTGMATDRLVFVDLALPQATEQERARQPQVIEAIVSQLSGASPIVAATPVNVPPLSGGWHAPSFTAEGQGDAQVSANPALNLESVHHDYFKTLDVALVRGRAFSDADRRGTLTVAVVSADVAAVTWPGEDPIGKRLKMGAPDSTENWLTIVGIAPAIRYRDVTRSQPTLYVPSAQFIQAAQTLAIQTTAPIDLVATLVRDRVRAVDANVLVTRVAPYRDLLAVPLARPRFSAFMVGIFGAMALLLATVGLYAVMAMSMRQREREIGIRVALGANTMTVRRLVLGEALSLTGTGVAIGLAGVFATAHLIRGLLFGVHPLDPWTLLGVTLLLLGAALVASWGPLHRARRIDPATMLRSE
jgi:putative ABC transport system permease protein